LTIGGYWLVWYQFRASKHVLGFVIGGLPITALRG
jgi:hypothetical protein